MTEDKTELPESLLHGVHELIEKERTLLELKLLDQKLESEKWKTKYDTLKEKIVIDATEDNEIENLEVVGNVEMEDGDSHVLNDINEILASRIIDNYIADLSNIPFNRQLFINLIKQLFGTRSPYPNIRIAVFKNCNLGPSLQDALVQLMRSSKIAGIDFSHNSFGEETFIKMLDVLQKRKITPQYLLLNANNNLAATSKSFIHLFRVLSEDTWGLSISLQDYPTNYMDLMEQALKKAKKPNDDNFDIRELVKPTLKINDFLMSLNEKIMESNGLLNTKSQKKSSLKQQAYKLEGNFEIIDRMMYPLKSLSVLGITECHISRKSLHSLEVTTQLLKTTLTDLDLSFCYMGIVGAETIKIILSDPESQLIRLDLKGNLLGDKSLDVISPALKTNQTLTYLNVTSNCLTEKGASVVFEAVKQNVILQQIDFRRNSVNDYDTVDAIYREIGEVGSELFFQFDEYSQPPTAVIEKANASQTIFMRTHSYKRICFVGKSCKLFGLNLASIYARKGVENDPLLVKWSIRPKSLSSVMELEKRMFTPMKSNLSDWKKKRWNDDPFLHINTDISLHWEIAVRQKGEIVYQYDCDISDQFVTKQAWDNDVEWLACGCILKDLPKKGTLELRARLSIILPDFEWETNASYLGIQVRDCLVKYTELKEWHWIGGDNPEEVDNYDLQMMIAKMFAQYLTIYRNEFKDHIILRGCNWPFLTTTCKITWQSKLATILDSVSPSGLTSTAAATAVATTAIDQETKPKSYELLHYEWCVAVIQLHGPIRIIQTGTSDSPSISSSSAAAATATIDATQEGVDKVIQSWVWQSHEVVIDNLEPGDVVLMTAKLTCADAKLFPTLAKKCLVLARNTQFYTFLKDLHTMSSAEVANYAPVIFQPEAIYEGPALPSDSAFD